MPHRFYLISCIFTNFNGNIKNKSETNNKIQAKRRNTSTYSTCSTNGLLVRYKQTSSVSYTAYTNIFPIKENCKKSLFCVCVVLVQNGRDSIDIDLPVDYLKSSLDIDGEAQNEETIDTLR